MFYSSIPIAHAALAAQTDKPGTEVLRQERVKDGVEAAVGVGETVGRQSHGNERLSDLGLVIGEGEVLDDKDDVDGQPTGAEHRDHYNDEPRHSASSTRCLRRPAEVDGPVPGHPAAAAAADVMSSQQPEYHAGVQDTNEGHRQNEGERKERSVEDSTIVRVNGPDANVETR